MAEETEIERYRYDQARAYLEHVRALSCRTSALRAEVDAQRELADGLKAIRYGECGARRAQTDQMVETVARLQELVKDYCAELAAYVAEQETAHGCVRLMERPEHVQAITSHYLLGRTWERVCVDMGYTWDGMMKMRRRAITEFYDVMPTEWRDPRHPAI
ncbi:hypothetical protein [Gordonibacter massiliensis (ex Traore et al. 2017)]|uniref:hypothetical protein n=1 Tax=Gordonibacter massiliensis (ex Traore et al. 2017) TaxID=1841863 RepID=UPI001C8C6063|nr:hypothetical protein [Gordonibacter massiliensis (ex Traore et al. 2017)]MBX9035048.1 hypothetical protein [Gordonibacter massiliensis (ex Traore et al. 2017)]